MFVVSHVGVSKKKEGVAFDKRELRRNPFFRSTSKIVKYFDVNTDKPRYFYTNLIFISRRKKEKNELASAYSFTRFNVSL